MAALSLSHRSIPQTAKSVSILCPSCLQLDPFPSPWGGEQWA